MKVLLTGASGFVGGAVLRAGIARGLVIRPVFRTQAAAVRAGASAECVIQPDLDSSADWHASLDGIDVVVHCAARAHVMRDGAVEPLAEYRRVNVEGTLVLAKQAAESGVKRFVFVSSIKVNGEKTLLGHPYTSEGAPAPEDAYGVSKAEAETQLHELAIATGMEFVIIRPVLVYGPGVKGNFQSLVNWVTRGRPLPLGGATANRRSFVALGNLVDLILLCLTHPAAANQIFLVSDGEDLSTAELLRRMGRAVDHPAFLLPVPVWLLRLAALALGKEAVAQRLLGSLQVDISKTRTLLGWTPPLTVDEGLRALSETNR